MNQQDSEREGGNYLFIGGPWDRQRRWVLHDIAVIDVDPPTHPDVIDDSHPAGTKHRYHRLSIRAGERDCVLYASPGMGPEEVMDTLLGNYVGISIPVCV